LQTKYLKVWPPGPSAQCSACLFLTSFEKFKVNTFKVDQDENEFGMDAAEILVGIWQ
jgi:hypothetical protein